MARTRGGRRRNSRVNGWLKRGFWTLFAVVGLYNLLLGSWFITKVALPIASEIVKYNISADSVEISLVTGKVAVRRFQFGPGWDPIVLAPEVTCRISRRALLRGRLKLCHVRADFPEVSVSRTQSGYYNVNKVRKAPRPPDPPGPVAFDDGDALAVEVEDVNLTNGRFRLDYVSNRGVREVALTAFPADVRLDHFRPGGGLMRVEAECRGSLYTHSLELDDFRMELAGDAGFSVYGLPDFASGRAVVTGMKGRVGGVDLGGRTLVATGEASGENVLNALQVKYIDVNICDAGKGKNTHVRVDGDLNFYPWKMVSHAEFTPVDDELFNYFNDFFGVPLRELEMSSNNTFTLDYEQAELTGELALESPDASGRASYDFVWNIGEDTVSARELKAVCVEGSAECGDFHITSPLTLDFHGGDWRFATSPELIFNLNRLNIGKMNITGLRDGFCPSGVVSAVVKLIPNGDQHGFSVSGHLIGEELELRAGKLGAFKNLNCNVSADGRLSGDGVVELDVLGVGIFSGDTRVLAMRSENCRFNLTDGGFRLTAAFGGVNGQLAGLPPIAEKLAQFPAAESWLARCGRLEFNISAPLEYLPEQKLLAVGGASGAIYDDGREILRLTTSPNRIRTDDGEPLEELTFAVKLSPVALKEFNGVLPFEATGGEVSGSARVAADGEFSKVRSEGVLQIDGGGLDFPDWNLGGEALDVQTSFSLELERGVGWKLNAPDFTCDMAGAPLLHSSFALEKALDGSDALKLNARIFECTGDAAKLFGGSLRSRLSAAGEVRFERDGDGFLNCSGRFDADGTLPSGEGVTATCVLNIDGSPEGLSIHDSRLTLGGDYGGMGRLDVSGTAPTEPSVVARLEVSSDNLFADKLFQMLGAGWTDEPDATEREPVIYFGERPFTVDVALNNVHWGDNINASIHGHVEGRGRELKLERFFLRFNGAELRASGELSGTPLRTAYHFAANADDMEISAVTAPFMRGRANSFGASTRRLSLDIRGDSLAKNGFWDTQTGGLSAEFAGVRLSHRLGETMIGRILLLPFSIVLNVQDFLPLSWNALTGMVKITSLFKRFYDNTDAFSFDRGSIALESSGGRVKVRRFELYGNPVNRFEFSGSFGLGSDRGLELRSEVDVMHMTIPVDIAGTFDEPSIDYAGITPNILKANMDRLMRRLTPEIWRGE